MSNLVPEGWAETKVSDVCHTIYRYPTFYGMDTFESGVPVIRGEHIKGNGKLSDQWSDYYFVCSKFSSKYPKTQLLEGDVVMAVRGTVGKFAKVGKCHQMSQISPNLIRLAPERSVIEQDFFFHNLFPVKDSLLKDCVSATGVPALNGKDIAEARMLLPPLSEQKKIAAILTSVDDVIEKTQAQIDKLKDLKTAMMQELLTRGVGVDCKPHTEFKDSPVGRIPKEWDVVTTGSIAKSIVPGRNKPKQMNGNIPWLTIADLGDVYVDKSKSRRGVTREVLSEAKGKTLPKNTVIMSVVGEFGLSSIAARELVINQQLHGFVCGNKVDPTFLCLSLRYHKDQMEKLATQTTIAYMNKDNAESVVLALPSLSEQRKIASVIISIEEKVKSVNKTLHAKTLVKKALMQDLLIGRVRVKVED
ncbi:restriction endonuclease subunit S [Vibrio campbellii]|uniref:restriction endonuclease subunit S n=1 Tax=Vibrio campbellii TaxID=680 RepID=UPI000CD3517B|nr:restriction endonuclease subunit S [Vibrio campbellii]AUW02884.1 hypothetical protein C1N51_03440 [Vibrio campbellii]